MEGKGDLPANLFSWKPWNPGAAGRTQRESLESPSELPIHWHLWMLPRWKNPAQTRINIILAATSKLRREGHSLFPQAVQITDSKRKRAEPKHVTQILEEIPAPGAWSPLPRNLGGQRGEGGQSHPKALLAQVFGCFLNFAFIFPLNFAPQGVRNK